MVKRTKMMFLAIFACAPLCTRLNDTAAESSCRACHSPPSSPPTTHHISTPSHVCSPALLSSLARVQDGETPLHDAAYNGHTAIAALLLKKGADVHAKDKVSGCCRGVLAPSARHCSPHSFRSGCCAVQSCHRRCSDVVRVLGTTRAIG